MNTDSIKTTELLVIGLLLSGCGEKKSAPVRVIAPPPSPAASVAPPPPTAPLPGAPTPTPGSEPAATTIQQPGVADQVDARLLPILEKYYNDQQRPAMNWNDLLAGKYISKIPVGADGKPLDWNTTMQRIGKGVGNRSAR